MRKHIDKLAMIVVLGSGFALAQTMPQQPATPPASPSQQTAPAPDAQQPSTAPDQSKTPTSTPDTLPSTDQKKDDSAKLPQSDAAPAATGDVQGNIQSAIQKDPSLANSSVNVAVNGKTVELNGSVPTKDAKDAAERIAKDNANGMKIKNHLKVAAAGDTMSDKPKSDMSNPK